MDGIINDIIEKKELLKQLPLKTKKNKIFYNDSIEIIEEKYNKNLYSLLNEIYKRKQVLDIPKDEEYEKRLLNIKDKILKLHKDMYILNPSNTEVEKLNLDSLFYVLQNFSNFSFDYIMEIFDKTVSIFEKASIEIGKNEFFYNYYVHNFMKEFLKVRKSESKDFNSLTTIFESFYWHNPDLILHIALNFRSIARKYKKKLIRYQKVIQETTKKNYKINSFEECKEKLKEVYSLYNKLNEEQMYNIIEKAKKGEIDIRNYFKDGKTKNEIEKQFIINDLKDEFDKEKFYNDIKLLKSELQEYATYLHLKPVVKAFKEDYQKYIVEYKKNSNIAELKKIFDEIAKHEHKIKALRKKYDNKNLFKRLTDNYKTSINNQSIEYCNELKGIYDELSVNYYIYRIKQILHNPVLINDMLFSYYSFDYYKKIKVRQAYETQFEYNDLNDKCFKFDYYALDPTHHLISSLPLFKDEEIGKILVTKHRLNNIAITLEDVGENNIRETIQKINLLLRAKVIENSTISAEQINFIIIAEKILEKEGFSQLTDGLSNYNSEQSKSHELIN